MKTFSFLKPTILTILFSILFLNINANSLANKKNNEINLGVGVLSIYDLVYGVGKAFTLNSYKSNINLPFGDDGIITLPSNNINGYIPTIGLNYKRKFQNGVILGGIVLYSKHSDRYQYEFEEKLYIVKESYNYIHLAPGIYYHYLKKSKKIELYLGAELGLLIIHQNSKETNILKQSSSNTSTFFSFNLTPFGIQLKTKVSPYLQLNLGGRGIIEGGVNFKF